MSKTLKIVIVAIVLIRFMGIITQMFFGTQFDSEFFESLDTQAIEAYCRENKNCFENENGSVSVFFEGEIDNSHIVVITYIYDENIFPSKAKVRKKVTFRLKERDTECRISKNNLEFLIFETTDKLISKDSQLFLQSIFEEQDKAE